MAALAAAASLSVLVPLYRGRAGGRRGRLRFRSIATSSARSTAISIAA